MCSDLSYEWIRYMDIVRITFELEIPWIPTFYGILFVKYSMSFKQLLFIYFYFDQKMKDKRFKLYLSKLKWCLRHQTHGFLKKITLLFDSNSPTRVVRSFIWFQNINIKARSPYSPNFNVVIHFWGCPKRQVYKTGKVKRW